MSRRGSHKRSRSWSWSRSRSRSPPGRHSPDGGSGGHGAEAASDPRTLDARVFVGSLTPDVTQDMLKTFFSKYGDVKGVLITKRKFGFVQFTTEQESTKCLADGPIAMVEGHKIDVKPAKIRRPGEDVDGRGGAGRGGLGGREGGRGRGERGGAGGVRGARRRDYDDERQNDYYRSAYYRDEASGRDHRPAPDAYANDYPDYYREYYDRYYRDNATHPPPAPPREYQHPTSVYSTDQTSADPPDPLDACRPNDVEIVVPDKMQRAYAESIEVELRRFGLLVDLLFPPTDVPSSRVLVDLTSRRCLYAVFVTPENEKHRSITLNILHGTPQEHRNMPVDDALQLVQRDFGEYVRLARRRGRLSSREIVPRDIRNLILDLLEARPLSMGELDKIIKYLKERQSILIDDQIELKRENAGE